MGNWSLGVFDNLHGSKIPLGPIRKLAGCLVMAKGIMFFNTRVAVLPSDYQLLRMTPLLLGWVHDAFDGVGGNVGSNRMAFQVLKFFKNLN
jgi:hypothetical protein